MSRLDNEIKVTPSVLDRLIDLEPRETSETAKSRSATLRDLKQSVRRDLEWLLNTRCVTETLDNRLEEAPRSVAFYGLPDFTGLGAKSNAEIKRLTAALENALRVFEPRFLDMTVTLDPVSNTDRQLKFRIQARLNTEPVPEPIVFDTILQLGSGEFSIKEK